MLTVFNKKVKAGFSLVELLVVISIIAVLTAITLPNFMGAREKARDSQRIQDLNSMRSALRMYYNDNQAYPTPGSGQMLAPSPFQQYFPAISNIGYTYEYYQTNNGDGFVTCVNMEARNMEAGLSQQKCGIPSGVTGLGANVCGVVVGNGTTSLTAYSVCAN